MRSFLMALAFAPMFPLALSAQEVVTGFGYGDFHANAADSGYYISADYLGPRDWTLLGFETGWGATGQLHEAGDVFLGGGLQAQRDLGKGWFVETSIMPGVFFEGADANDLGSTFEIRSLLGIGRDLRGGRRLSLALSHISNASLADRNPGLNGLSLRLHIPLQGGSAR